MRGLIQRLTGEVDFICPRPGSELREGRRNESFVLVKCFLYQRKLLSRFGSKREKLGSYSGRLRNGTQDHIVEVGITFSSLPALKKRGCFQPQCPRRKGT